MEHEILVELVRGYPELYDMTHSKYSDNVRKEEIWKNIGENLGQTGNYLLNI